jgi:signal transduction histidine kinase
MLVEINALQAQTLPVAYTNTAIDRQTTILNLPGSGNTSTIHIGLQTLEQLTHEALTILRTMLEDQPPAELEELTLAEVLSRLVEESAERLGIASRISFSGVDEQGQPREQEHVLSPRAQRLFLLLIREALYGIEQRHDIHRLRLTFNYGENEAQLNLEDDGLNSATTITPQVAQNDEASNTHILE